MNNTIFKNNYLNIVGIDEESKTVLAESGDGSIIMDTIPAAFEYMQSKSEYTMLLKGPFGVVCEIRPTMTLEGAKLSWHDAMFKHRKEVLSKQYPEVAIPEPHEGEHEASMIL